jgi:hypothetical protein
MLAQFQRYMSVCCLLAIATGTAAQVRQSANAQSSVWRPVWFVEGPIQSLISPDDPGNELRVEGDQIVLMLRDGQRWAMPLGSLQTIRYFRHFERAPVLFAPSLLAVNPAVLHRSTNHLVDLVFVDGNKQEIVLSVQLDKAAYQPALATLHQLTSKPVLASAEDAKSLPSTVKVQLINHKRTSAPSREPHMGPAVPMRMVADDRGRLLAAVLTDGTVQVWDIASGLSRQKWPAAVSSLRFFYSEPAWIAFRPGTSFVAASATKTGLQQWDAESGVRRDLVIPTRSAAEDTINDFPVNSWFTPDGSTVIVESYPDDFSCWDAETGDRLNHLELYKAWLRQLLGSPAAISGRAAAFNTDGTRLALAASAMVKRRWQTVLAVLEWPSGHVLAHRLGDVGDRLEFVSKEELVDGIRVWRFSTPQSSRPWNVSVPLRERETAIFDQQIAVRKGWQPDVMLYSVATGRMEGRLPAGAWVTSITSIPGRRLAVGTVSGTVQIWDISSQRILRVLESQ